MSELTAEIFAVGKWNGMDFSLTDLEAIAKNFSHFKDRVQVPLKLGHNEEQPMKDGDLAIGWVSDVWVEGQKLFAKFMDLPDIVTNAIKKRLYRNVSIELDIGVEHQGTFFSHVLSGVALLGADLPAVTGLADLDAYMSRKNGAVRFSDSEVQKRLTFTFTAEGSQMTPEEIKALQEKAARADTLQGQVDDLAKQNATLISENAEAKQKFSKLEADVEKQGFAAEKAGIEKRLDDLVKAKAILPAQREAFMKNFKEEKAAIDSLKFSIDALEDAAKANPATAPNESATAQGGGEGSGDDEGEGSGDDAAKTPDVIVFERAKKLELDSGGKLSFGAAKEQVLVADSKLAREYMGITGGIE